MIAIFFTTIENAQDRSKMEQIWNTYYGLMLKTARSFLDEATAYDAVQDSCIKIIRNLDKIQEISSYQTKGYIVNIVRNTSIDIVRKAGREITETDEVLDRIPSDDIDILDNLTTKESVVAIKEAIKHLPDQLKDIVYLHLIHEHSHAEIAKMLNITEAASKMRLHRAKKEIKKRLAGDIDGKNHK